MSREWKPGDVAMVVNKHGVTNRAICQVDPEDGMRWVFGVAYSGQPVADSDARPLVVIDPEDADALFPLLRYVRDTAFKAGDTYPGMTAFTEAFQSALRSLVAPPKPDEPKGLGAVVEDEDGRRYVRNHRQLADMHWDYLDDDGKQRCAKWVAIPAVRVLSEGVA